ncbi:MAG: hypothetical protein ABSE77_21015 [Acidimicrobiales bacterium]|jgi:hypothetical protein
MSSPGRSSHGPSGTRPPLSDEAISPDSPPDPNDSFKLPVEGANEYAVVALSPTWASVVVTPLCDGAGRRISSVLADTIVQRLFKIGLDLAGLSRMATNPEQRRKAEDAMLEADIAINEVRNAVFNPAQDLAGPLRRFCRQ